MNDELKIRIGKIDGKGRREIFLRNGEYPYNDNVDLTSGFQRVEFLKRALPALGVSTDQLASLDAELGRLAKSNGQTAGETKERFPIVTSAALDNADYTPRSIIAEALFAGVPAVIGAPFKTCKSLVGIDAAVSISTGRPWLRSFTVPTPLSVVYFSGEGGPCVAQEYGRRIAASKGIGLADVTGLRWCFSVPRLEDQGDLDAFAKVLDDTAAETAVIDNLMLTMSGDRAGNVYSMGGVFANVIQLCSARNVTPILIHHFKRGRADQYAPGELADLTQAGVAEVAGQWWLLTRRERYDPAQPGEHRLWLSIGGRVGHSSLHALDIYEGSRADPGGRRWDTEVRAPDQIRNENADRRDEEKAAQAKAALERDADKVLRAVAKLSAGMTKNAIRDHAGLSGARANAAIAWLLDAGAIQSCELTISNHRTPQPGYKLTPS